MKTANWKVYAAILVGVVLGVLFLGRSVTAQFGTQTYHVTQVSKYGPIEVKGDIMGFSCASDVEGAGSSITTQLKCYILSK